MRITRVEYHDEYHYGLQVWITILKKRFYKTFLEQEEIRYMKKKKHIPPSRIRYEKKYPVWPVRMPKEWIEYMELYLRDTGQSRRDFIGASLGKQKADYTKIREEGFEEGKRFGMKIGEEQGYKKAEVEYKIWYNCYICNGRIIMMPNSDGHRELIKYMRDHRWAHVECAKKSNFL